MRFRLRADRVAGAILVFGLAALLGGILTGRRVLVDGDALVYYYPAKTALRRMVLEGRSLLWNPLLGEGQPLAGNPEYELFYPATWLLFVLPVKWALALSQGIHLALAFWGSRRFFRRLPASEGAALAGAASWAFGGVFVSAMHFFPHFYALTWLPWLAATMLAERFRARTVASAAVFGALILLAGEPMQSMIAAGTALAAFASRRVDRSRLAMAAAAGILAVGLAAAAILPGAALARKSIRSAGIPDEWANLRSLPPVRLRELLGPRLFGDPSSRDSRAYRTWTFYPKRVWPFYWGLYGGVLVLPLAAVGAWRRRRLALPFALLAAFSLAVALGPYGPVWTLARRHLPFWRGVRYPEKVAASFVFALVTLSVLGFDAIRRSRLARGTVIAGLIALGVFFASLAAAQSRLVPFPARAAWPPLALAILLLALGSRDSPRAVARGALTLILGVIAVDAVSSSRDFMGTRPAAWVEAPPPVVRRLLRVDPPPRLVDELPPAPDPPPLGVNLALPEYERARLSGIQAIQWRVPVALDLDFDMTYLAASVRSRDLTSRLGATDARVFSRVLAGRSACAVLTWKVPFRTDDPVTLLGIPGCRPVVDSALAIAEFSGDDGFLLAASRQPGDFARTVFVEGEPSGIPAQPSPAIVKDVRMENDAISFSSESPGASLIRIAVTNDGNWHSRVDGQVTPTRTVDLSLIGVVLPPGRHRVELRYRDPWLAAGMAISAATVLALLAIALSRGRKAPA